jgi:hypothetical protein
MYFGVLHVLSSNSNPDRFALAAHGIREIMEKIPSYMDLPVKVRSATLTDKFRELDKSWVFACTGSNCKASNEWMGNIDGPLKKFLRKAEEIFKWFNEHHPKRKAQIGKMLQQLDEPNRYLPPAIADLRIDEWDKIRDYFVNVAHHSREATNEEFAGWQDTLERFLLDRLKPRTFVDFDMIDEIIREGENDAGR